MEKFHLNINWCRKHLLINICHVLMGRKILVLYHPIVDNAVKKWKDYFYASTLIVRKRRAWRYDLINRRIVQVSILFPWPFQRLVFHLFFVIVRISRLLFIMMREQAVPVTSAITEKETCQATFSLLLWRTCTSVASLFMSKLIIVSAPCLLLVWLVCLADSLCTLRRSVLNLNQTFYY